MADITVKVLTSAAETDLLTLDEAKLWLGINAADTSQDAVLQSMITMFSEEIAERLNRHPTVTIGYEEVQETWRDTLNGRLFLTHWPVKAADVLSVSVGSGGDLVPVDGYELAEDSGKLSNISLGGAVSASWNHPVVVHYSGGYNLPDGAPKPLKHAVVMLIREERIKMVQSQTAGVRQLRHKESQVSFFDPNALLMRAVGTKSPTLQAVENILTHYMRFPV
jgi:gp6-like head-tail connector protein